MKKQRKAEEMDLIISAYERSGQGVREYGGHTPKDVVDRLNKFLKQSF